MSYLEQYTLQLHTLSPLFIGSGESLTKKEYLFIPQKRLIIFPEPHKLFNLLERKKLLNAYEDFILGNQKDLYVWLTSQRTTEDEIASLQAYAVHAGNAMDTATATNLTGIQFFTKDPCNRPYLPGSSVKGALRTALLALLMTNKNHDSLYAAFAELIRQRYTRNIFSQETKNLESEYLHTLNLRDKDNKSVPQNNAVNSLMKGIQISDSKPLSHNTLTVCAKIDYNVNGQSKKNNIARECLKPGTVAEFSFTLDTQILKTAGLNTEAILQAIRTFYTLQNKYFLSKFTPPSTLDKTESNGYELFLGGGTGFVSKTIIYPMFKERGVSFSSHLLQRQFPKHFHDQDTEQGVSPHMLKCTRYDNKIYLMGRCEVSLK
mgnify:CR=1 FL=1